MVQFEIILKPLNAKLDCKRSMKIIMQFVLSVNCSVAQKLYSYVDQLKRHRVFLI